MNNSNSGITSDIMKKVKNNEYKIEKSNLDIIQKDFISESCDENETLEIIKQHFDKSSVILDPHTAVGIAALRRIRQAHRRQAQGKQSIEGQPLIVLSTAHPAKFKDVVEKEIGKKIPLPKQLAAVSKKPKKSILIAKTLDRRAWYDLLTPSR